MKGPSLARTSISSGLILAFLTALATAIGVEAMASAFRDPLRTTILYTIIAWPFASMAHYAGSRWVGFSPTPFLDALVGRGSLRASSIGVPSGAVYAVPTVILSIGAALWLAPEITRPDGIPFADLGAVTTFRANLLILSEEFIFRLVALFPLLALFGVRGADRRAWPTVGAWMAIVISSLAFGAAHFGMAEVLGADPTQYMVFALVQKGLIAGMIFGWVAWRWGVESAIVAHYTTNILLVLFTALASA